MKPLHTDKVIATISTTFDRDTDNMSWQVEGSIKGCSFDCYEDAENHIKSEYMNQTKRLHRGSGRDSAPPVIESMNYVIEDSSFVHEYGQSYTFRINGILAGSVFLNDDRGWTINGVDYQDDWRTIAGELAMLTRRSLVAA